MTEEVLAAPLDAYATAKPDEPTFTLQGGDPLAPPLVRAWAFLARRRAGFGRFEETTFAELIEAAIGHSVADDEHERSNLLVRASAAEDVSWSMDEYRKGNHAVDVPSAAVDTHLTELERIDLHALRVRIAQGLSNFRCGIAEMRTALADAGFAQQDGVWARLLGVESMLDDLNTDIEPRRMMRKD